MLSSSEAEERCQSTPKHQDGSRETDVSPPRILLLSTYPIVQPQHGGQKRVMAIVQGYHRAGFNVAHCAIFCATHYNSSAANDIPLSRKFEQEVAEQGLIGDMICGRATTQDPAVRGALENIISRFRPDAVQMEHPFLYRGVREVLTSLSVTPLMIYSSHNIESHLKLQILLSAGWDAPQAAAVSEEIRNLERDFSRDCDLLVACTEADLAVHREYGADKSVLASNGIEPQSPAVGEILSSELTSELNGDKFALFVGSAHLPNLIGYQELIGPDLSFLPLNSRVVAVGGVCNLIRNYVDSESESRDAGQYPVFVGPTSEGNLRALIHQAEVILLPITQGGGSNLKSAEAIASGRKVVASAHSLRSFEWFAEFPNVWVADTAREFRVAIAEAFDSPRIALTEAHKEKIRAVYWDSCLKDLMFTTRTLLANTRGER